MCGIFGIINSAPIDEQSFVRSTKLLNHRGPDSMGVKFWNDVGFGFTRLAIQDLTKAGDQPMTHPNGKIHLVFNGEIYNYKILREELIAKGITFISNTDTEVILQCYFIWGWEEMLKRLEGMFAIALYDETEKVVYLARDQFGQKPLFYCECSGKGLIFSSEIKAILNYTGNSDIDFMSSLNPLFTTGLSPRGKTMMKDVSQIEEGGYLKYDLINGSSTIVKYFHVSEWVDESMYKELSSYSSSRMIEVYEQALSESVQRHLISDAPLASLFSAGLDSSVITAMTSKYRPVDLYYFESELLDHMKYPRFFSEKYNMKLKIEKGNDQDYIFKLPRMIYHYETINKEDGVVLANLCRFAREDGIKVLLTGDASDELFGGQPHFADFMIKNSFYNSKSIKFAMKVMNHFFPNNITKFTQENPLGTDYLVFPPGEHFHEIPLNCLYHRGERLKEWQDSFTPYYFVKDKNERELLGYMLDEMAYRFQRYMIRSDRFGMMESVELRTPYLHPALVKLAVNTPSRWRMKKKNFNRGFEKKHIIKKLALKQGLPREYVYRKKLMTPHNNAPQVRKIIHHWNFDNLASFLNIKQQTLKKIISESYDPDLSRMQFSFISFEIFMRIFIQHQPYQDIEEEFKRIIGNGATI